MLTPLRAKMFRFFVCEWDLNAAEAMGLAVLRLIRWWGAVFGLLISYGASCILTEVPEMFGAEHLLMKRCPTKELFDKTVNLINSFKDYFTRHGQVVYENPSPATKRVVLPRSKKIVGVRSKRRQWKSGRRFGLRRHRNQKWTFFVEWSGQRYGGNYQFGSCRCPP